VVLVGQLHGVSSGLTTPELEHLGVTAGDEDKAARVLGGGRSSLQDPSSGNVGGMVPKSTQASLER
jgi:hypothetical protein